MRHKVLVFLLTQVHGHSDNVVIDQMIKGLFLHWDEELPTFEVVDLLSTLVRMQISTACQLTFLLLMYYHDGVRVGLQLPWSNVILLLISIPVQLLYFPILGVSLFYLVFNLRSLFLLLFLSYFETSDFPLS